MFEQFSATMRLNLVILADIGSILENKGKRVMCNESTIEYSVITSAETYLETQVAVLSIALEWPGLLYITEMAPKISQV